jgi:hypothetical protein
LRLIKTCFFTNQLALTMRRIISTLFAAFALIAVAQAQVFFTQNFAGGTIPAGWTTTDGSGNGIIWEGCTGPSAGCVDLYGRPEFASTTAANGFVVLDSDAGQELPSNHISRLTTSAIDCSGKSAVFATFENAVGVFTVPSTGAVLLKVSTNGTTWTSFDVVPGLSVSNRFSANPEVVTIDISAIAANQATVFLQWEWTGNYEYWWMLDDVSLTDIDPTPANDLTLSGFYYPVSSFATPVSQISTDVFGFSATVTNSGIADQNNVEVKAEVLDLDGFVLFADSVTIGTLPVGYVDSFLVLPNTFTPDLPEGEYLIRYIVSNGEADGRPDDNVNGDFFVVTSDIFSKENGPTGALRPGGSGGDYAPANLYQMSSASLENYRALGFEISAATNPGDPTLENGSVTAYLFRVNDDVDADWSNFDDADLLSTSFELKGLTSYEFPDGASNYTLYPLEILDADLGTPGVSLDNGARYVAAIGYADGNNLIFHAYGDETNHTFVSSMVYTSAWFLGGFGEDYNAVIRMVIELASSVDETPLPETAVNVFPNPVSDVLNLQVAFDQPTNATITIADINGRVINIDNRQSLTNDLLTYNVPQLAAGTYLVRVATTVGTKTTKFVVVK